MTKYELEFKSFNSNLELVMGGSKSISQRSLIIRFLRLSNKKLNNISNSNDTRTLNKILNNLKSKINVKDGGTTLRFLLCALSLEKKSFFIDGDLSLAKRPLKNLIVNLQKLGVNFTFHSKKYQIPLTIKGANLKFNELIIDSNESSQFASGLALIAPYVKGGLRLKINRKIVSKSFFDMTIKMMKSCGINMTLNKKFIAIKESPYLKNYDDIESDWTSLSYIYQIIAFSKNKSIKCSKFNINSLQGDSALINFFSIVGVKTFFRKNYVYLQKNEGFKKPLFIHLDISDTPDLAFTYIITCLGLSIKLKLTGIETLKFKESNRLFVMKKELEKLNVRVVLRNKSFSMNPANKNLQNLRIDTHFDHRVALSFAPLVIISKNIIIKNPEVVNKSYPKFWTHLKKIGIKIS